MKADNEGGETSMLYVCVCSCGPLFYSILESPCSSSLPHSFVHHLTARSQKYLFQIYSSSVNCSHTPTLVQSRQSIIQLLSHTNTCSSFDCSLTPTHVPNQQSIIQLLSHTNTCSRFTISAHFNCNAIAIYMILKFAPAVAWVHVNNAR